MPAVKQTPSFDRASENMDPPVSYFLELGNIISGNIAIMGWHFSPIVGSGYLDPSNATRDEPAAERVPNVEALLDRSIDYCSAKDYLILQARVLIQRTRHEELAVG